jgi:GT2 family glycosyltransferase
MTAEWTAQWAIAKALEFFDARTYEAWKSTTADEPPHNLTPPEASSAKSRACALVSFIICDHGDSRRLETSLTSCAAAGEAFIHIVVATQRDRAAAVHEILTSLKIVSSTDVLVLDGPISPTEAEAQALSLAMGMFVAFLAPGDKLATCSLAVVAALIEQQPSICIIYSDEDWLDDQGQRFMPRFKTGWDPDAQLGRDLLGQFCLMRRDKMIAMGGLRPDRAPAAHYDLHCRLAFAVSPTAIRHIPAILCHRQQPYAHERARGAEAINVYNETARAVAREVASSLCGREIAVTDAPLAPFVNRIHWPLPDVLPQVSVLVPTRDCADLLQNCTNGVLEKTDYPSLELLVLDNGSVEPETEELFNQLRKDPRVKILPLPGPFNYSKINNRGAAQASGEILLFMNNDVEVIGPGWVREIVAHALRSDIGCVGAKLLYADRRLQHAGVVLQPGPDAIHVFRQMHEHDLGYDAQLAGVRSYSAVTGACLAVRRSIFEEVGGFDERGLKIAFNDVDLCLKVDEHGYRNVCTPFEPLFHLESASRGLSTTPEKQAQNRREVEYLAARWSDRFTDDPFLHPSVRLRWDGPEQVSPRQRHRHPAGFAR